MSILVATDGSPAAQAAVEEGVRIAKEVGTSVIFVSVAHPPLPVLGDPYYQRALTAQLGAMRAALAKAIPFAKERRVPYEAELIEGEPADTILGLARSRDVDLVVVGSRGLGSIRGALLGSVSSAVVHHADRSVLVVKPSSPQLRRAV